MSFVGRGRERELPEDVTNSETPPQFMGARPGRFDYLRGNGAPIPEPTFLERLARLYPASTEPQFSDGTQQHILREVIERGKSKKQ